MHKVPRARMPVLGRIFAHRRNANPVLKFQFSNTPRGKQRHVLSCSFHSSKIDLIHSGLLRVPKIAVPTRISVEPSRIAASKSCDMPMERTGNTIPSQDSSDSLHFLSCVKNGRASSGFSKNGGMHIRPAK